MFFKYAKNMSDKEKKERELIQKVQTTNDRMAMRELVNSYKGAMVNAINTTGVAYKTGITQDTAMLECEKIFKDIVKNKLDLNMQNQPSTYIISNLTNELRHYIDANYEQTVRKPAQQTMISRQIGDAEKWMEPLGIEITPENTEKFIRENFGLGGSYLNAASIGKTKAKTRKELSGDQTIGGESAGNAEPITMIEYLQGAKASGSDYVDEMNKKQQIENAIMTSLFSNNERKFIRQYVGMGEFEAAGPKNMNAAAMNAGLTYSQAKTAVKKLQKALGVK